MLNKTLSALWSGMLHFVYPYLCEGCGRTLMAQEDVLCIECTSILPFTMFHHIPDNLTAQRFDGRVHIENATSLAYYTKEGLLQYLLEEFKYHGNKNAGAFLGMKLGQALRESKWASDIDIVVPVPLHKKSRGGGDIIKAKLSGNRWPNF